MNYCHCISWETSIVSLLCDIAYITLLYPSWWCKTVIQSTYANILSLCRGLGLYSCVYNLICIRQVFEWSACFLLLIDNFSLIDEGGDWDRRNRLKVYKAIYSMANRQFSVSIYESFRYITTCDESTPRLNLKLIQLLMSASNTLFRLKFQV